MASLHTANRDLRGAVQKSSAPKFVASYFNNWAKNADSEILLKARPSLFTYILFKFPCIYAFIYFQTVWFFAFVASDQLAFILSQRIFAE